MMFLLRKYNYIFFLASTFWRLLKWDVSLSRLIVKKEKEDVNINKLDLYRNDGTSRMYVLYYALNYEYNLYI